ncbi:MAG TPA: helix-turn-helix transcriptional regulator [Solirubrobacteraceae bacterium]|nr:helix-turn-helix transcriptional regulator [Solirubrobacteraceae bacterium]
MGAKKPLDVLDDGVMLQLVGDVVGLLDLAELRSGILEALESALPSEHVSLNEIGSDTVVTVTPSTDPLTHLAEWEELAGENPLLQRYLRTHDGQAYRFSDVIEPAGLHALALYRRVYAPLGIEHQIAFNLPAGRDQVLAIALSRAAHDYTDAERDFVNRVRPFLIQAYLNALAFERARGSDGLRGVSGDELSSALRARLRALGLTVREAEVVALVATGASNHRAAAELKISHRTVGKHLERGYRKLGVADRYAAAARVWALLDG